MKVTIVLRSPFLDKIPNLKNLVIFLAAKGVKMKILSAYDSTYPQTQFSDKSILVKNTNVRTRKLQVPTSIGIGYDLIKDILFDKSDVYISGDAGGAMIIADAMKMFNIRHWHFLLEYPDIFNPAELKLLQKAEKIITHDKWHSDFLNMNCGTNDSKFLYLPNSTFTDETHEKSNYLAEKLGIDPNQILLLHSGGLGRWFMCKELAKASTLLPDGYKLVFHTSHNTKGTAYYEEIIKEVENANLPVLFSLNPVSDSELDTLVASATIGLAIYSIKELGYRAENMGLAAGKIGNYLKCGLPVIATKVHSLSYLEEYKCGVLIESLSDLGIAVEKIMSNYEEYRNNAYRCYRELWEPTAYLNTIYSEIKAIAR